MKDGVISPGSLLRVIGRNLLWILLRVIGREELIGWNNFFMNRIGSLLELGYCSNKLDGTWSV